MWKIEMDQASAGAVLAVLVGAAACIAGGGDGDKDTGADTGYSLPYVPRDSGWGGGGDGDGDTTGDISSGAYGIYIESTCGIIWDMTGSAVGDLAWEVNLYVNALTDCSNVEDVLGRSFELRNGWAYFENDYVGIATYGGGTATWATSGYITGGGGGSYYYAGRIDY